MLRVREVEMSAPQGAQLTSPLSSPSLAVVIPVIATLLLAASALSTDAAGEFLWLGFTHILPHGLDHVLFVLGLFFCCREFGVLLGQVTLFTVAHSLSLGVAVMSGWEPPPRAVELAIVLSIAFVALGNVVRQQHGKWSYAVTFAFGLVHGLGFADAFRVAAGNAREFAVALLSFNVGVEAGQLVVVLAAFAIAGQFWERAWYRRAVAVPASVIIAAMGVGWAVARTAA
jgi:hypothetical protein